MTKPFFFATLLSCAIVLLGTGCYNDNREDLYPSIGSCDTITVSFSAFIAPLMNTTCATSACHDAATASFALILDNYTDIRQIALNGKLLGSVTHASGFYPMPKNAARLDDCTIAKIRAWINAGAPEN